MRVSIVVLASARVVFSVQSPPAGPETVQAIVEVENTVVFVGDSGEYGLARNTQRDEVAPSLTEEVKHNRQGSDGKELDAEMERHDEEQILNRHDGQSTGRNERSDKNGESHATDLQSQTTKESAQSRTQVNVIDLHSRSISNTDPRLPGSIFIDHTPEYDFMYIHPGATIVLNDGSAKFRTYSLPGDALPGSFLRFSDTSSGWRQPNLQVADSVWLTKLYSSPDGQSMDVARAINLTLAGNHPLKRLNLLLQQAYKASSNSTHRLITNTITRTLGQNSAQLFRLFATQRKSLNRFARRQQKSSFCRYSIFKLKDFLGIPMELHVFQNLRRLPGGCTGYFIHDHTGSGFSTHLLRGNLQDNLFVGSECEDCHRDWGSTPHSSLKVGSRTMHAMGGSWGDRLLKCLDPFTSSDTKPMLTRSAIPVSGLDTHFKHCGSSTACNETTETTIRHAGCFTHRKGETRFIPPYFMHAPVSSPDRTKPAVTLTLNMAGPTAKHRLMVGKNPYLTRARIHVTGSSLGRFFVNLADYVDGKSGTLLDVDELLFGKDQLFDRA